jgi:hypothetical protein
MRGMSARERSLGSRFALTVVLLLGALACGSSQSAATHPATPAAAVKAPPPPPVPEDPLALIPSDAALMAQARIDVMKERKAFASLRRAALRYGCIGEADFDWLTAQTQRALVATRGDDELLVVLAGQFAEADATRALELIDRRAGRGGKVGAKAHGRFQVSERGGLAASVLEGRLLVAGSSGFVASTLDSIEHPPAQRFADSEIYRELGNHVNCMKRPVCGLIARDGPAAKRMQGELGQVGLKNVGRDLAESHASVTLAVGEGMNLTVVALTRSEQAANELAQQTRNWLWQAGLVARLAGFPDVLGGAEVDTEGSFSQAKIRVPDDDLERVEQRLYKLVGDGDCRANSAAHAPVRDDVMAAAQHDRVPAAPTAP